MKLLVFSLFLFTLHVEAAEPDWVLVSPTGRAEPGAEFPLVLAGPHDAVLPEDIALRVKRGIEEFDLRMKAVGPAENGRRRYAAVLPRSVSGVLEMRLADPPSNAVVVLAYRRDSQPLTAPASGEEPLLSQEEPMYFVVGARDGANARFQLSFKYRLFDNAAGFGRDQPWLAGIYFAYTQNSLWDLKGESRPFRDTSYRPSVFWKWERADDRTWIAAFRFGAEHESNGREGEKSRSLNILFLRPEWRWKAADVGSLEFTPKIYHYFDKGENADIEKYRGYVDWRLRWDSGDNWITTAVARTGTAGYGSLLVDLSRRTRDLRIGSLSGYFHAQYFNGYGEDILDYNVRRKWQLRLGFAIVP